MNLNSHLKDFFFENEYDRLAEDISIIRKDGIPVFSNRGKASVTIGALISGLWQASESLSTQVTNKESFNEYRLAFDSSDQGVYVLPLVIFGETYFLSAIYNKELNPGKLKNQMRLIKSNIEIYMSSFKRTKAENREGYLFEDITDEEIDRMFQVSGI
ncbi:MAG: hypothetical protein CME65_09780 [Halobacteriovoraceae bacterium]|nr:hypothetical protein [Halobacteriovoraceae bacterium]|tara:strand:- start:514 stop:987 length:474 start_codon:yes stop_codon:yes gene_type:complete